MLIYTFSIPEINKKLQRICTYIIIFIVFEFFIIIFLQIRRDVARAYKSLYMDHHLIIISLSDLDIRIFYCFKQFA